MKCFFHGSARRIGPEIASAVPFDAPHQFEARKFLFCIQTDGIVRLVIPQHDVVVRLQLLDQGVFQDEGFFFRPRDDPFEILYFRHHERNHGPAVRSPEVGANTVFQIFRLPHVNDRTPGILH